MSRSLICLVVVSMVFIISAGIANARSCFESEMVPDDGGECKISCNGFVKMEITGAEPDTDYTCCIHHNGGTLSSECDSDEDGEIKDFFAFLLGLPATEIVCAVYEGDECGSPEEADFVSGIND